MSTAPPPPVTVASSADGAAVFAANCTGCHGKSGNGDTAIGKKNNIPDFHSADVQSLSDAELARIIREGRGPLSKVAHPGKHLTSDQVNAVVAYIRTLNK
jgi:mono/diheme cytochrome c family protein